MMHFALVNPNTNAATTMAMLAIARATAGVSVRLDGWTAKFGTDLICDETGLATAADAVVAFGPTLQANRTDGVIIAAFGDPGRAQLARELPCPVVGIAEAGMAEATQGRRRFSVVTTTPDLVGAIMRTAELYGLRSLCTGVLVTPEDPRALMADPPALEQALLELCERAIRDDGAQAIVIGGGPLAMVGRALARRLPVPVIEPIPAAVRLLLGRIACRAADLSS